MKGLTVILLNIFPLMIFCQSTEINANKRISMGLSFSFDHCYRTLRTDSPNKNIVEYRNENEIPNFGYTTGIMLCSDFYKRFVFELGLFYSDKGEKTKMIESIWVTDHINIYHYYFLDIPFKANYYFRELKKGGFFVFAGFSPSIFIKQKTKVIDYYLEGSVEYSESDPNDYSGLNLFLIAGIGYHHSFSDKIFFKIQPVFRQSVMTSISIINPPLKEYLYSLGLDVGIYFKP